MPYDEGESAGRFEEERDKGGRPRLPFGEREMRQLRTMAQMQCTARECAEILGMSVDTLDRRLKEHGFSGFADFYKQHSAEGKASLRRMQWEAAKKGNAAILIWLGKQMLGQRDRIEHTGAEGGPIETSEVSPRERIASRLARLAPAGDAGSDTGGPDQ